MHERKKLQGGGDSCSTMSHLHSLSSNTSIQKRTGRDFPPPSGCFLSLLYSKYLEAQKSRLSSHGQNKVMEFVKLPHQYQTRIPTIRRRQFLRTAQSACEDQDDRQNRDVSTVDLTDRGSFVTNCWLAHGLDRLGMVHLGSKGRCHSACE